MTSRLRARRGVRFVLWGGRGPNDVQIGSPLDRLLQQTYRMICWLERFAARGSA